MKSITRSLRKVMKPRKPAPRISRSLTWFPGWEVLEGRTLLSLGLINTVAGAGTAGFGGDGGQASDAQLWSPAAVAVDLAGNLYIADQSNHRVREVLSTTGEIITIAGNGTPGFTGDGGPATNAQINSPSGLAVDLQGNVYFSDSVENVVREILVSSGTIITVAGALDTEGFSGDGGPATSASLNHPLGLAVDPQGNLLICDAGNSRVREVSGFTGDIMTVAGNGTYGHSGDGILATEATLKFPASVSLDEIGNLYFSDTFDNTIRKIDQSTGIMSTVAGNGKNGFSGDGGVATQASLAHPDGVAFDGMGNIYIADTANDVIRKVDATGQIQTIAGQPQLVGFAGDGGPATAALLGIQNGAGLAVDASGNLILADMQNQRIRQVAFTYATSMTVTTTANPTVFGQPLTLLANVSAETPGAGVPNGGTVQFFLDGLSIGDPVLMTAGQAVLDVVSCPGGDHTIFASYSGDGLDDLACDSTPVTQTILPASTTVIVATSSNPLVYGQAVGDLIYTASITANPPSLAIPDGATVQFQVDGLDVGSPVSVVQGTALLPWAGEPDPLGYLNLNVGPHILTAIFRGDGVNFEGDVSAPLNLSVIQAHSQTSLSILGSGNLYGQPITLEASVLSREPSQAMISSGAVQFTVDGFSYGDPVPVSNGVASLDTATLNAGPHTVQAIYLGDAQNFLASESETQTLFIASVPTQTTVNASSASSVYGESVTYTATVRSEFANASAPDGGTIQFMVDSYPFGEPVVVVNGVASLDISQLNAGFHNVSARYSGDGQNSSASQSTSLTHFVTAKQLEVSIVGHPTKVYNSSTAGALLPGNFAITGLVGTDSFQVTQTSGTYNSKNVSQATHMTAYLVAQDFAAGVGTLPSNYILPTLASGAASITKRALIGTITVANKEYDGTTAATITARNLSGAIFGDDVSYVGGTASFANVVVQNNKLVTTIGLTLAGLDAENYSVNTTATATANLTSRGGRPPHQKQ